MKKIILLMFLLTLTFAGGVSAENKLVSLCDLTKTDNGYNLKITKEEDTFVIWAYYNKDNALLYTEYGNTEADISEEVEKINIFGVSDAECYILKLQIPNVVDATDFVIPAKWNEGLTKDITPYYKDGVYYLFVPQGINRENVVYTLYKENAVVKSFSFNFKDTDTAYINLGYERHKVMLMQSDLPSVMVDINDEFGTIDDVHSSPDHSVYAYGDLKISVPEKMAQEKGIDAFYESVENDETSPMTMKIRGRGHTSWTNVTNGKYPYQINLEKKASILGMEKSKKWVLLKDDVDIYRNAFAFDLAKQMGLSFTPDYEFVDLFINGEYKGIYILCEKIEVDEGRVDIPDLDKKENTEITGGYLLEIANGPDDLQFDAQKNNVTVISPEKLDKDVSTLSKYSYIVKDVRYLFAGIYDTGSVPIYGHFADHIDLTSFSLYFWHQEFFGNLDAGSGSTYLYKLPTSLGGLYYMGPVWDNDYTFPSELGWVVPNLNRGNYEVGDPTIYKALCQHEEFTNCAVQIFENKSLGELLLNSVSLLDTYKEKTFLSVWMNEIKFGNNNLEKLDKLKNSANLKAVWLNENYHTLTDFITKGASFRRPL